MTLCKIWNAGRTVERNRLLDRIEVSQRAWHGKTLIECRRAGCGWVGPCGIVAKCGACGENHVRLVDMDRMRAV